MAETVTKLPIKQEKSGAPSSAELWRPFETLRGEIDRMFDEVGRGFWPSWGRSLRGAALEMPSLLTPAVDVVESDKSYEITTELPGMNEKNIEVKLADGVLTIKGTPVGQELGQYYLRKELQQEGSEKDRGNGSCMIVLATDAPLEARNVKRLAARALLGVARTGSAASNGSGDYAIAFCTAAEARIRTQEGQLTRHVEVMTNDAMSPLFLAAIEATEEAIYNAVFRATTTTGHGHTIEALPIDKTTDILRKYGAIK